MFASARYHLVKIFRRPLLQTMFSWSRQKPVWRANDVTSIPFIAFSSYRERVTATQLYPMVDPRLGNLVPKDCEVVIGHFLLLFRKRQTLHEVHK